MRIPAKSAYYDLDPQSYHVWVLTDGKRSVKQILEDANKEDSTLDSDSVYGILLFFAEAGALEAVEEKEAWKRFRVISAFEVRLIIIRRSQEILRRIHTIVKPILQPFLLWVSLGFVILVGLSFATTFVGIFGDSSNFRLFGEGSTVVTFFVFQFIVLMPVIAIHEMSHGLALAHFGGTPGEIGTGLFYFGPMFYVDATDSWSLTKRQRILVMLAGVLSTVLIGSIIAVIYYLVRNTVDPFTAKLLMLTSFWCFYGSLWNLAPPFETDGYYVLADLVNTADLKRDAYDYLKNLIKRTLGLSPVEVPKELQEKRRILLGYVALSLVFMLYIVFATLRFTYYMAQDVYGFVTNIAAGIISSNPIPAAELLFATVSIFYFLLTISGYGVVFFAAAKKAATRALRVEAIHDRDLAVFFYLPSDVRESTKQHLEAKMRKIAKDYATINEVTWKGPLCSVILRLGGTKLAMEQVRKHLAEMELTFRENYEKFIQKRRIEIHRAAGIHSERKVRLTRLLHTMAAYLARSGDREARRLVPQILSREITATEYLLNSAFGTVWTIELPPAERDEFRDQILPALITEDLGTTDLYGDVENFKKNVIYGFESLASLAYSTRQKIVREAERPESFHVVFSFEPIRGRLLFAGRTEEIEADIGSFGSVLLAQVWAGYLDYLMSETNLSLAALGYWYATQSTLEEIEKLRDGEIDALWSSLNEYAATKPILTQIKQQCSQDLQSSKHVIRNLQTEVRSMVSHGKGLLNAYLTVNSENLQSLTGRLAEFDELMEGMGSYLSTVHEKVDTEHEKRLRKPNKAKKAIQKAYPAFLIPSILLILLGLQNPINDIGLALFVAAVFIQVSYVVIFDRLVRRARLPTKYPNTLYFRLQTYLFTLVQALHNFSATADILRPSEVSPIETKDRSEATPKRSSATKLQ